MREADAAVGATSSLAHAFVLRSPQRAVAIMDERFFFSFEKA